MLATEKTEAEERRLRELEARVSCEYVEELRAGRKPDIQIYVCQLPAESVERFYDFVNVAVLMTVGHAIEQAKNKEVELLHC